MVDIISRAAWGARPWRGKAPYRVAMTERTEFFAHYHGDPPPTQYGVYVPRNVEVIHLANGWSGTGYNFMVDMEGLAYEGRGWDMVGAHCPRHNRQGIGVYLALGGGQQPTDAALATVRDLYDEASERAGRVLAKKGHRDGKPTACPGDLLYDWVRAGMVHPHTLDAAPRAIGDGSDDDRPVLVRGTNGRHVVALQNALAEVGYDLNVDGIFGPTTLGTVMAFQSNEGLMADGIVGPATYAALSRTINEEEDSMKTLIVKHPDRNAQYLVVPGVSRKHVATTADVRTYEAAGAVRAELTAAELDAYPDLR